MYIYDDYDQRLVNERVEQYRDQTRRFLAGELGEAEFRTLRLMNGLYIQTHGPMLRISVPYGLLASRQLRMLAHIARKYDKGFGHFTTRQNIQFHWPKLEQVPDILADLASVQMHSIQTSGNCIRNVTSDHLAGVAQDEVEDPRPYCELIRQWATFHPEFVYLPRKFKFAVTGAKTDRAAIQVHDIGLHLYRNEAGETGFRVLVGGGLGRTPKIGKVIREFLSKPHLLSYMEAILRVYNRFGRRDNLFKSRIKILVDALGAEKFRQLVDEEWQQILETSPVDLTLDQAAIDRMRAFFAPPPYAQDAAADTSFETHHQTDPAFATWIRHNTTDHKIPGYRAVFVSLKAPMKPPGDITHEQMDLVADLADEYSFGMARSTHSQNLLLADVKQADLYPLWKRLDAQGLATANIGTLSDIICCPGLDFCSLANARSMAVTRQINETLDDMDYQYDLGELNIRVSGCINACTHHHVAHIGLLGVDKKGEEWYQLSLGGSSGNDACIGKILGPSVPRTEAADVVAELLTVYVEQRQEGESFLETYRRIGMEPFREKVYAHRKKPKAHPGQMENRRTG